MYNVEEECSQTLDVKIAANASRIIDEYSDYEDFYNSYANMKMWDARNILMLENKAYKSYTYNFTTYTESSLKQPAIILTGYGSGSATEIFADFGKLSGRFLLLGTNTAGGTGDLFEQYNLPFGMTMGISTRRNITNEGYDIQNNGVQPHIWCEQTIEDYYDNIDTCYAKAIALINLANNDTEAYEQYITDNKYEYTQL